MTATSRSSVPLTPGLRNSDKPDHWLVPPWPRNASYCAVVRHFLRWQPRDTGSARIMLAYFRGYQAALEQAPTHELTYAADWTWFEEMHSCISWCILVYEAELQGNGRATLGSVQQAAADAENANPVREVSPSRAREAS